MALFGFGKSKSSSQSQSESLGLGYGYSGSESLSDSLSRARSGGQSTQGIAFEELFRQLFGNATGATQRAAELAPALTGQAAQLFGAGTSFLDSLTGSAVDERLADEGTADAQIGLLGRDLEKFFREGILPGIASRGVATGTLGGSRGEVAKGIAAEGLLGEFVRGTTGIRTADVTRRDELAQASDAGAVSRAATGLSSLGGLFDLASAGSQAGLSPYLALAQILGGPTVLTESSQFGESDSIAQALSRAFGEDFSYDSSKASSSSKGKSLNFSLGFGG